VTSLTHGQWDTGPLENAQQCEGIVYANDVGLSAISMNGTASVDLEWTSMASYGASGESGLVISAGPPSFCFFALEIASDDDRAEWIEFLDSKAVPEASEPPST